MNEFLSFYYLFNVIKVFCSIFIVFPAVLLVISVVYITDYTSDQQTKNNFKLVLLSSVFVLLIAIAVLSVSSVRKNNLFTKYVASRCDNLKKVALLTDDGEYKIKYFDTCVAR